jgi:colanic acid/amylovoran biosynthesis glycosyltransferase
LNICYLTNQYPKVSHTFIRREILALESFGANVLRVAARKSDDTLVDPDDISESQKTIFLVNDHLSDMLAAAIATLFTQFFVFFKSLVQVFRDARTSGSFLKYAIYFFEACYFKKLCEKHNIEHVHCHFGTNPASVAYYARLLGGASYSFTVHGPDEFDAPVHYLLREKIEQSKFVVAITSYCKSQLFRWIDFKHWDKVRVVRCGVDNALLEGDSQALPNRFNFLNIGRLCEQKGQMLLLKAVKLLKDQGHELKLNIIGDGNLRAPMEEYVKTHGLENSVAFLGWKSSDEVIQYLDDATIMVLPSFAEGLPVVIMEALARARPVITTYIAGIPELVDQEVGWLTIAGNEEKLSEVMLEALSASDEKLSAMGAEGKTRVADRHSQQKEAEKLLSYFRE